MTKKLFLVEVEFEYAVFAKNEEEAINYANEAVGDALLQQHCHASPLTRFPDGWTSDCLVYGTNEDVSLGEAIKSSKQ